MKFELDKTLRGASDEEVLDDVRRCADALGKRTLTIAEYEELGIAHPSMVQRRFGSWTRALGMAGLEQSRSKIGISNEELFENLRSIWVKLNRQPKYMEMKSPFSEYSVGTYEKRFRGWRNALIAFVEWVNTDEGGPNVGDEQGVTQQASGRKKTRTPREPSERQRFRILLRDGFRCLSCGASPLNGPGVELHVDHIIPWSKFGETVDSNLQTKCSRCNLGKGNVFEA